MKTIKVLGPGCAKCQKLFANVEAAVKELGIDCDVQKITDIGAITSYGVMMTPSLVVDEEVRSSGKALSVNELKAILEQ
jgi:small redox-active disulfide protein 2